MKKTSLVIAGMFLVTILGMAARPYLAPNDSTSAQLLTIVPNSGEIIVNKSKKTLVVGDGTTIGGLELMRQDLSNATAYTANRALISNSSGAVTTSSITDTKIGYLTDVTSNIQAQINAKQAIVSGVSDTEIGYLDGVTSAIQTQIDGKEPTITNSVFYVDNVNGLVGVHNATPAYNFEVNQSTTGVGTVTVTGVTNEVQNITPDTVPDTGTYTITFDSKTTAAIAFDADATAIQSALDTALLTDVTATGSMITAVELTFVGAYAAADQANATCTSSMTTLGEAVTTTTTEITKGATGTAVAGTSTEFLNTFKVGDTITVGGETKAISAIASNVAMTTAAFSTTHTASAYTLTGGNRFYIAGNGYINIPSLTASRALVLDSNKNIAVSATTGTELGYVNGVTSAIQTQLGNKAAIGANSDIMSLNTITKLKPATNSTAAITVCNATDTAIINIDTTNNRLGVNAVPGAPFSVKGPATATSGVARGVIFVTDTTAYAAGVGGCVIFAGKYNAAGDEAWNGYIGAVKTNATDGDYSADLVFGTRDNGYSVVEAVRINHLGKMGIGIAEPTARLHVPATTTAAYSASIKVDSGVLMTTPEHGAIESDGVHLYWTDNAGARHQLDN